MRCARQSTCGDLVKETGEALAVDGKATIRMQGRLTPHRNSINCDSASASRRSAVRLK